MPFAGAALGIVAERIVEVTEVGEVRHVHRESLDARRKRLPRRAAVAGKAVVDLAGEVRQRLDEVRRVAPSVVDVDLDEDAVARRLVDLDVETLGEEALERGAVEAGLAAKQS